MYYNCFPSNIIWIDRGIILTIIYFIIKYYKKINNKIIIIDNLIYRDFIKSIFPELNISENIDNKNNFYFNIRKIIKNQDIIINHVKLLDEYIYCHKIKLIPWYDLNDPIVAYKIDNNKINIPKFKMFLNRNFMCKRGKYFHNMSWDIFIEYNIIKKYSIKKNINFFIFYKYFNSYITNYYVNIKYINYIEKPILYTLYNNNNKINDNKNNDNKNNDNKNNDNNNDINELIKILNDKIDTVNSLID